LLLELADRGAERRLRHVQVLRRAGEVALLRDGDEVPDESQLRLHVRRSYAPRISKDRIGLGQTRPGSSSWIGDV
jgi:hypothetical protein